MGSSLPAALRARLQRELTHPGFRGDTKSAEDRLARRSKRGGAQGAPLLGRRRRSAFLFFSDVNAVPGMLAQCRNIPPCRGGRHVLLDHKLVNSTVPGRAPIGLLEDQRLIYEREARAFAAELLMPLSPMCGDDGSPSPLKA